MQIDYGSYGIKDTLIIVYTDPTTPAENVVRWFKRAAPLVELKNDASLMHYSSIKKGDPQFKVFPLKIPNFDNCMLISYPPENEEIQIIRICNKNVSPDELAFLEQEEVACNDDVIEYNLDDDLLPLIRSNAWRYTRPCTDDMDLLQPFINRLESSGNHQQLIDRLNDIDYNRLHVGKSYEEHGGGIATEYGRRGGPVYREIIRENIENSFKIKTWYKDGKIHRVGGDPAQIYSYLCDRNNEFKRLWLVDDKLHREGGPAVEHEHLDGHYSEMWCQNGVITRKDGPAIISFNNSKGTSCEKWCLDGKFHRDNGPAVNCVLHGGVEYEKWYKYGDLHRAGDKPAYTKYNPDGTYIVRWYIGGKLHRAGGKPAVKYFNPRGEVVKRSWYVKGVKGVKGKRRKKKVVRGPEDVELSRGREPEDVEPSRGREPDSVECIGTETKKWFDEDGNLHNEDGPALIERFPDGGTVESWFEHGKLHRLSGPAIINKLPTGLCFETWYKQGDIHRAGNEPDQIKHFPNGERQEFKGGVNMSSRHTHSDPRDDPSTPSAPPHDDPHTPHDDPHTPHDDPHTPHDDPSADFKSFMTTVRDDIWSQYSTVSSEDQTSQYFQTINILHKLLKDNLHTPNAEFNSSVPGRIRDYIWVHHSTVRAEDRESQYFQNVDILINFLKDNPPARDEPLDTSKSYVTQMRGHLRRVPLMKYFISA